MKGSSGRRHRRKLAIAGGLIAVLVVAVPAAWAVFDDVPPSNVHYNDVNAIQGAGITAGCAPNLYCPGSPVRRDQMATFIRAGAPRSGLSSTSEIEIGPNNTDLGSLTITVGGGAGQTQFVKLDVAFTTYIESTTGCPCSTGFVIWSDELNAPVSNTHYSMNPPVLAPSGFGDASGALTTVVQVPTASTQTFRVYAFRNDPSPGPGVPPAGDVFGIASMSAITAPFGSTGTNILGAGTVNGDRASGRAGRRP